MMSMQVDQIKQNRIRWNNNYLNPNSEEYVTLEDEAVYAVHYILLYTLHKYSGSLSYADLSNAVLSSVDFWKDSNNFEQCDFIYYKVLKIDDFEICTLEENRDTQDK